MYAIARAGVAIQPEKHWIFSEWSPCFWCCICTGNMIFLLHHRCPLDHPLNFGLCHRRCHSGPSGQGACESENKLISYCQEHTCKSLSYVHLWCWHWVLYHSTLTVISGNSLNPMAITMWPCVRTDNISDVRHQGYFFTGNCAEKVCPPPSPGKF